MPDDIQIFPPKSKKEALLEKFAKEESPVLYKAKSVFPFSLFANKLYIYPSKVDVIIGEFFKSSYTKTFFIEDIVGVEVVTIPFLASVKILTTLEPLLVSNLKRKDAIKIKQIIDELLIASKKGKL